MVCYNIGKLALKKAIVLIIQFYYCTEIKTQENILYKQRNKINQTLKKKKGMHDMTGYLRDKYYACNAQCRFKYFLILSAVDKTMSNSLDQTSDYKQTNVDILERQQKI